LDFFSDGNGRGAPLLEFINKKQKCLNTKDGRGEEEKGKRRKKRGEL